MEYGFRLPSALDNRPLKFEEFEKRMGYTIYTSATPGPYEMEHAEQVVEQIIRPTGLVDPEVEVRPIAGPGRRPGGGDPPSGSAGGQRTLVTTLTKRMAEDLADYLMELGIKVHYLHSEVDTLERIGILRDLRLGVFDVVVGINLLREGLDLPEVSLVAILDADKEGFLRSGHGPDPDHRARRPPRRRAGDHVRRPHHQFDAPRHRRDQPPPRKAGRLQHRSTASSR